MTKCVVKVKGAADAIPVFHGLIHPPEVEPHPLTLEAVGVEQRRTVEGKTGITLLMRDEETGKQYAVLMIAALYLTIGGAVKGAMTLFDDGEDPEGYP